MVTVGYGTVTADQVTAKFLCGRATSHSFCDRAGTQYSGYHFLVHNCFLLDNDNSNTKTNKKFQKSTDYSKQGVCKTRAVT